MVLCSLKHFHMCSFASAFYCSGKLAQLALRSSSSYGQETEDLGGEMICPDYIAFKLQNKFKNSAAFDNNDFAA